MGGGLGVGGHIIFVIMTHCLRTSMYDSPLKKSEMSMLSNENIST